MSPCNNCQELTEYATRLEVELGRAHLALRNVLALARKMERRDVDGAAQSLRRFCAEAGIVPRVLCGLEYGP